MSDLLDIDFEADPLAGLLDLDVPADVPASSLPVHTVELGSVTVTVIRVDLGGRDSFQVYAVSDESWALVSIWGLFVDALREIRLWRLYLADGHSLAEWVAANPDGCRPDVSAVAS